MTEIIKSHCPVCKKETTSEIILDGNAIRNAVIGTFVFVYIHTTRCTICHEKTNRYEFEITSE